jgi:CYTH domain-containing protein
LASLPAGVAVPVRITDRYLTATRLRVRRIKAGSEVVDKLAQKVRVRPDSPAEVKLTNMYLSEQEYEVLRRLPGLDVHKTRWRWQVGSRPVAVDEFSGRLAGLVLAEVELAPGEDPVSLPVPAREVTHDDRFSGGRLVTAGPAEVAELLALAHPGPAAGSP